MSGGEASPREIYEQPTTSARFSGPLPDVAEVGARSLGPAAARPPRRARFALIGRMIAIARGVEYATAREVALVVARGSAAGRLDGTSHVLATPPAPLPILEPILSVLPGQLLPTRSRGRRDSIRTSRRISAR